MRLGLQAGEVSERRIKLSRGILPGLIEREAVLLDL